MSIITRQVSTLRELAELQNISYHKSIINRAADTIEALTAKLAASNMQRSEAYCNDRWIYCGDGKNLPEEKINPVTKDFYEYQVTFQSGGVKDVRHYKFGNGHWLNGPQIMDEYVTAWRVPIKPFNSQE